MKKIASFVLGAFLLLGGFFGLQDTASASELSSPNPEIQNDEISPDAIFVPDFCIIAKKVIKQGSGWYVDGYFLDKKAKEGFFSPNPKVGSKICIMTDNQGLVVGWKVI